MEVSGHRLILTVGNAFYEEWLGEPDNLRGLENTIRYHAVCPADMRIEIRVVENREKTDKIRENFSGDMTVCSRDQKKRRRIWEKKNRFI